MRRYLHLSLLSTLGLVAILSLPAPAPAHFCGDGEQNQLPEQCDGDDDAACPGMCTFECLCAVCGDGIIDEPVEQCDGNNAARCPGNCQADCSCPTCGNDLAEFPELCDGSDDGLCPGLCSQQCRCPSPCEAIPDDPATCRAAEPGRAQLKIRKRDDAGKDRFKWKWSRGEQTQTADFLDPAGSAAATYGLCLHDGVLQPLVDAQIAALGACGGKPCWKAAGKGFKYKDKAGTASGVTDVKLGAGATGKARVQVKARGAGLNTPAPKLQLPVTVQLVANDGATRNCWQTVFTAAAKNQTGSLSAKGP